MRIFFLISRMPTRRNRTGPVSRVFSPVSGALGFATRSGSRAIRTVNSVWSTLGNGVRKVFNNATHSVNNAGRHVLTGQRGGRRHSRSHSRRRSRTRKHKRRH